MNVPDADYVIVTYNSLSVIDECLRSLADSGVELSRVYVVDNNSSDATVDHISESYFGVNVIRSPENLGFSRANNLGVRAGSSDVVVFSNPDVIFLPGAVHSLVEQLTSRRTIGICGPLLVDRDQRPRPESYLLPTSVLGTFLLYSYLWRVAYRVGEFFDRLFWPRPPRRRAALSGACLAVRREDFLRVGGFDEDLFMYFEDLDLCERILRIGLEVVQLPKARVVHLGGRTYTGSRTVFFNSLRSMDTVLVKNSSPNTLLAKRLIVMAGLALRWVAFWLLWRAGLQKHEYLPARFKEGLRPFFSTMLLKRRPLRFPSR